MVLKKNVIIFTFQRTLNILSSAKNAHTKQLCAKCASLESVARLFLLQEESLLAKCASLEADNKKFEEDLAAKYKAVDESFAEKEKLLREYYQQLSDQLNQSMNN